MASLESEKEFFSRSLSHYLSQINFNILQAENWVLNLTILIQEFLRNFQENSWNEFLFLNEKLKLKIVIENILHYKNIKKQIKKLIILFLQKKIKLFHENPSSFSFSSSSTSSLPSLSLSLSSSYSPSLSLSLSSLQSLNSIDQELSLIKSMNLCEYYYNEIINLLENEIQSYIRQTYSNEYNESCLNNIKKWIINSLFKFCSLIFNEQSLTVELENKMIQFSSIALVRVRSTEFFDIIVNYPESTPAIIELRDLCPQVSSSFTMLGKELKESLGRRLLHIGASTTQIIDFYILMIKSLRILDKSNLLLDHVAKPIRKYLISRKDTIRCIVSSLTEKKDDLHNVLRDGGSLEYGMDSDDEAADLITANICDSWNPPIRALDFPGTGSHDKDILALLVSIYGSTDLFVSEYRSILADRLLANSDYNIDTEVATLELLKIRFGEEPLHSCEVMLHDIDASKRMNQAVNSVIQQNNVFYYFFLSSR